MPPYGSATLADVLPGAATALGVPVERGDLPADPLDLTAALGGARRVMVLLVDGLGADLLRTHADLAPTLAEPRPAGRRPLRALPQHHPGQPRHARHRPPARQPRHPRLRHRRPGGGPHPQPRPVGRRPRPGRLAGPAHRLRAGRRRQASPATAVGPYAYAGSGLTRAVYRGADLHRRGQPRRPLRSGPAAPSPPPRRPSSTATSPSSTSPVTSAASTRPAGGPSWR